MKLIYCNQCEDIFNLKKEEKTCGCGESRGRYIDNINAEIKGDCVPMGISNFSFIEGIQRQAIRDKINPEKNEKGIEIEAFFIPELCKTIKRI